MDPRTPPTASHEGWWLCEGCSGINIEKLVAPGGYEYVLTAAAAKCSLCKLFGAREENSITRLIFEGRTEDLPRWTQISSTVLLPDNGLHVSELINVFTNEGDPAEELGVCARIPLSNTASPRTGEVINDWLEKCHLGHPGCFKAFELSKRCISADRIPQNQWPARLIDLNAHGEGSRDAALVDTGGKECPVYVTLSYCWGKDPDTSHTTTAERLAAHQKRIFHDKLPLTLQHALYITRQLKVRYIWIDGLCIIQGSKEDWERESGKMYAIYRNSFVTIAADSSPETTAGCFNKSSTNFDSLTKPVRIRATLSDMRLSCLYIGKTVEASISELILDFERTFVDRCALATRGWAFQERIMSPRLLHYTDRQVFWECNRGLLGEDNLWGHRDYRVLALSKNTDRRKVFDQWLKLVEQYTQRHLTQPADKLPAISGLARVFCKRLSSRYLAGLWFDGLHRGLAWARDGPIRHLPSSYRCPSFSWAYLDSQVDWPIHTGEYSRSARIEKIELQLEGSDPFGRLSGGFLCMTGALKPFLISGYDTAMERSEHAVFYGGTLKQSNLALLDGEMMATATMDTDCGAQRVMGLLLSYKFDEGRVSEGCVLLLRETGLTDGEFRRVGISFVMCNWREELSREFWGGWSTHTITIV